MRCELLEARRLLSFGDIDLTFGSADGRDYLRPHPPGTFASRVYDAAVLSDGRIVTGLDGGVTMRRANGTFDTAFSGDGFVELTLQDGLPASAVAVAPAANGKAIVLVADDSNYSVSPYLIRLNPDGSRDMSFGNDGVATLPIDGLALGKPKMAVAGNGRIVVTGAVEFFDYNEGSVAIPPARVLALTAGGQLETGFGTNGVVIGAAGSGANIPTRIAIDAQGRVMLFGTSYEYHLERFPYPDNNLSFKRIDAKRLFASRLTTSGGLDTTFEGDGVWLSEPTGQTDDAAHGITAVGYGGDGATALMLASLRTRTTVFEFGQTGLISGSPTALRTTGEVDLYSTLDVAVLNDGKTVIATGTPVGTPRDTHLVALRRVEVGRWEIRPGFSTAAQVPVHMRQQNRLEHIAIQPDGKIVIAGHAASDAGDEETTGDDKPFSMTRISGETPSATRQDEIENASVNDIAYDGLGNLHVAWLDSATQTLKYKHRDSAGRWGAIEVVDSRPLSGQHISVSATSDGTAAIAYYDGTSADLRYATRAGGSWATSTVDARGVVGQYPSLQFDRTHRPWIAYYAKVTGDLRLAYFNGTSWKIETIDAAGNTGLYPTLTENLNSGRWAIAYSDSSGNVYHTERRADRKWARVKIATSAGGAKNVQLVYTLINGQGADQRDVIVAWYDAGNRDLLTAHRKFNGTTFSVKKLASKGTTGLYPNVFIPSSWQLGYRVVWYDRTRQGVFNDSIADPIATGHLIYVSAANFPTATASTIAYVDAVTNRLFLRAADSTQ